MPAVLIVEDSPMVMKILKHIAQKTLTFDLFFAESRTAARSELSKREDWLAGIIDLNLPDSPDGELVEDVLAMGIPTIVLTASVNNDRRDSLLKHGIVDYVLKEGRFSYQYAVNLVNRLYNNQFIKVLIAEDSRNIRRLITELLKRHLYQVIEADNGQSALERITEDSEIRVLLTDNTMPKMNGFELIHALRMKEEHMDLVIIGLSSSSDKYLSAKFIKHGANDFLFKPFSHEEFYCRMYQAVESMERLDRMRHMAYTDALTDLGNRRYFIEQSRQQLRLSIDSSNPVALAIMDIDHFKLVNDTHGHDVGDAVLARFGHHIKQSFPNCVCGRTGGEEFAILFANITAHQAFKQLELFRKHIANDPVEIESGLIQYTISIGVAETPNTNLEALMKSADELLYHAKSSGRNQVAMGHDCL